MGFTIQQYRNKAKIRRFIQSLLPWQAQSLMVAAVKYVPYQPRLDSYVIPKSPNSALKQCPQGLNIPPDELTQEYYEGYLPTGEKDVATLLEVLEASGFKLQSGNRILEMGCATGRMLRHLKPFTESCEIWGIDIDAKYIYWCQQNLNPPFHFATTTTIPHLPFGDGYFNLIYTGSVFTHIDDLAEAWFLELSRLLSPSGRLYVTICDSNTVNLLDTSAKDNYVMARKIMSSYDLYNNFKQDFGMLVVGRDTASQVFYDVDYLRKIIPPTLKVLSITQEAYGYQSAVVLERGG